MKNDRQYGPCILGGFGQFHERVLGDDLGQLERLRQLQRELEARRGSLVLAAKRQESAELRGDRGDVSVRLLAGERLERLLESRDSL